MIGSPIFRKELLAEVLAKEFKEPEAHELVKRTMIGDYPVKVVYTAEAYADALTPLIYAMNDRGLNHTTGTKFFR